MSTPKPLAAAAMAALLVLAGCAGPVGSGTAAPGGNPVDAATPDGGTAVEGSAGTVEFYVSDEENAIDDFAHLNVTITKVGLHRAGAEGDGDDGGDEADDGESEGTETPETNGSNATAANATSTPSSTATPTPASDGEREDDGEAENDDEAEDERAGWVEYEVNRTVDLTELKGSNATKLGSLAAPDGSYDEVFVHVGEIEATLENGEQVNVKLPSEKLQIKKGFTVGDGRNVSFVFDISVHGAGNSGKYILKPVISESGTSDEVEIDDVDEREGDEEREDDDDEREDDGEDERDERDEEDDDDERDQDERADDENGTATDLSAEFQGPVEPGREATVKVTGDRGPVANATVEVDDGPALETDESGTVTFTVPEDAKEIEVEVTKVDAEAELEREFERGDENPSLPARV